MPRYSKGDKVKWNWTSSTAAGKVTDVFTDRITRTIKGNEITRNADKDNPAYLIKQEDGDRVLKSESELQKG